MSDIYRPDDRPPNSEGTSPRITIVAAVAANGVIGRDGELPWHLSADLRRFKQLTMGHCLVMGRRTYDSIGRALPGRVSIVISRRPERIAPHPRVRGVKGFAEALAAMADTDMAQGEVFVIGGAEIYQLVLPWADRLHLTRVHARVEGDAQFPAIDRTHWHSIHSESHPADAQNDHAYTFEVLERIDRQVTQ